MFESEVIHGFEAHELDKKFERNVPSVGCDGCHETVVSVLSCRFRTVLINLFCDDPNTVKNKFKFK